MCRNSNVVLWEKKKKEFLSQLQGKNYFYGNTNIAYDFFRQKASGHYFPI